MPLPIIQDEEEIDSFVDRHMDHINGDSRPMDAPLDYPVYRQKVPGWIRWPIRCLLLPYVWIDTFAQKLARLIVQPPYKTSGSCKQRGACCRYILIEKPRGLLGKIYIGWFMEFQGFYPKGYPHVRSGKKKFVVMGCRYLQSNGRCGHYTLRPQVCRKWPVIEHFGAPELLKGCGFKAELKKSYHKKVS